MTQYTSETHPASVNNRASSATGRVTANSNHHHATHPTSLIPTSHFLNSFIRTIGPEGECQTVYESSTYLFSLTHSDPNSTRSQCIIAPFLRKLTILRHRKPLQSSSLHQRLSLWSTSFSTRLDCFYRPFASAPL